MIRFMISQIVPAAVGNALQIFLAPPADALSWRLLRNETGVFADQSDPAAVCLYGGNDLTCVMDSDCLVNGKPYCYCVFYCDGAEWAASAVVWATPASTYTDQSVDVLSIVRDRLDCGLQTEILLGNLSPSSGAIAVLNAPPVFEETSWPVVTVHLTSDASGERGIGELLMPDAFDPVSTQWRETQGWLARVQLTIVGWSKNPDERIDLRKALRKIVIGNLDVFDSVGMVRVDFSQQDVDELSSYPAPVYQVMCTFSCEAPAGVSASAAPTGEVANPIIHPVF
jgi:hypothetical protein